MQRLLLALTSFAVGIYYRRELVGEKVPSTGPVILVANHPNGLVDPVMLGGTTRRPLRFLGKAPLFELPVLGSILQGFRALPVYRAQDGADTTMNERTFEAVYGALRQGDVVCLFPEGRSHDEPTLQKLKTGAARMALGAEASAGNATLGVRIQPVGLVYRAKRRFRSRACACVGKPIEIGDLLELHRTEEREAVHRLNERIAEGLRKVILELEHWEELPLLEFVGQVLEPAANERPATLQGLSLKLARIRSAGSEEECELLEELTCRVTAFRDRLQRLGLEPGQLHAHYRTSGILTFIVRNLISLLVLLPLALIGSILWFLPYQLVPAFPRLSRAGRDTHATVKILAGLVLFPAWWVALGVAAWLYASPLTAALTLAISPATGLLALSYRDWRREALAEVRAFLRVAGRRRLRARLVAERDELAAVIEHLGSMANGRERSGAQP